MRSVTLMLAAAVLVLGSAHAGAERLDPERLVNQGTTGEQWFPTVAALAGGGSLVVWQTDEQPAVLDLHARLLDSHGLPAGAEFRVPSSPASIQSSPKAAGLSGGGAVVVWSEGMRTLRGRVFDGQGQPLGNDLQLADIPASVTGMYLPSVEPLPNGGFAIAWQYGSDYAQSWTTRLALFDANGARLGPEIVVADDAIDSGVRLAAGVDRIAVCWSGGGAVRLKLYSLTGEALGGPIAVGGEAIPGANPTRLAGPVMVEADGRVSASWQYFGEGSEGPGLFVRRFDVEHGTAEAAVRIALGTQYGQSIEVAKDGSGARLWIWNASRWGRDGESGVVGRFFDAAWKPLGDEFLVNDFTRGFQGEASLAASSGGFTIAWASGEPYQGRPITGQCGQDGSFLGVYSRVAHAENSAPRTRLDLAGGRFRIEADWKTATASGAGRAVALSAESGAFWFSDQTRLDVVVKLIDARAINRRLWVFHTGMTDVAYTLRITDTLTGTTRAYSHPAGARASVADTRTFRAAGPTLPGEAPLPGECEANPESAGLRSAFLATVTFVDPATGMRKTARSGFGGAFGTALFWFFDRRLPDLAVEVEDRRAIDGHWRVRYGGLSNVEYDLTITNRATGEARNYHNPAGVLSGAVDPSAF